MFSPFLFFLSFWWLEYGCHLKGHFVQKDLSHVIRRVKEQDGCNLDLWQFGHTVFPALDWLPQAPFTWDMKSFFFMSLSLWVFFYHLELYRSVNNIHNRRMGQYTNRQCTEGKHVIRQKASKTLSLEHKF